MKRVERQLKQSPPVLEVREAHLEQTRNAAARAFRSPDAKTASSRWRCGWVLGVAAAFALGLWLSPLLKNEAQLPAEKAAILSAADLRQLFDELSKVFPEDSRAIISVRGEFQILTQTNGSTAQEPTYLEMRVDGQLVRIIASQGGVVPFEVSGRHIELEFVPDSDGQPVVLADNLYWSQAASYVSEGQEITRVERLGGVR